jgi:hypothetical protein
MVAKWELIIGGGGYHKCMICKQKKYLVRMVPMVQRQG